MKGYAEEMRARTREQGFGVSRWRFSYGDTHAVLVVAETAIILGFAKSRVWGFEVAFFPVVPHMPCLLLLNLP